MGHILLFDTIPISKFLGFRLGWPKLASKRPKWPKMAYFGIYAKNPLKLIPNWAILARGWPI